MTFSKSLLYHFVRDALGPYSEHFSIKDKQNPMEIQLNDVTYGIHISYVHDSGKGRPNEDEQRIQIPRKAIEIQKQRQNSGSRAVFIGFFESGQVFTAWEPEYVFSQRAKDNGSVYARKPHEEIVENEGAAAREFMSKNLGRQSLTIALRSNVLGFYLENIEAFHRLQSADRIQSLLSNHDEAIADHYHDISNDFETGEGDN